MKQLESLISIDVTNESETEILANDLSIILSKGDSVAISGDLGAGKTTFCRHVIRSIASEQAMEVPSPTFSLVQNYDLHRFNVAHLDLYRIESQDELLELGIEDFINDSVMLIEWAENGRDIIPDDSLWIRIKTRSNDTERQFNFHGNAERWKDRLNRTRRIREFLNKSCSTGCFRNYLQGDASSRQYETISEQGEQFVLMNAPMASKEPKKSHERTYSEIVHATNSTESFVAVGKLLEDSGIRVPKTHALDLEAGLLLLEYLGNEQILKNGCPIEERYLVAVEVLAKIHELDWPSKAKVSDTANVDIPEFDLEIMLIETEVFLDWYVAIVRQQSVTSTQRRKFLACWSDLYEKLKESEKSIVLRDYHSPNLLWQSLGSGTDRIGVLDFQDALIGPSVYDLVSLVQDARARVPVQMQERLMYHYIGCRASSGTNLDSAVLERDFAILATQRVTRIIGTFVRLAERDGKPGYLNHIPRLFEYLHQNLKHFDLSELKECFNRECWI